MRLASLIKLPLSSVTLAVNVTSSPILAVTVELPKTIILIVEMIIPSLTIFALVDDIVLLNKLNLLSSAI